jgi:hypothetical protein
MKSYATESSFLFCKLWVCMEAENPDEQQLKHLHLQLRKLHKLLKELYTEYRNGKMSLKRYNRIWFWVCPHEVLLKLCIDSFNKWGKKGIPVSILKKQAVLSHRYMIRNYYS